MQLEFITLAQVLDHIDSGKLFDIEITTADVKRGTGGELKAYSNCVKHTSQRARDKQSKNLIAAAAEPGAKAPNHRLNGTKNIYLTRESEVRTIHIRLITRFNGLLVS